MNAGKLLRQARDLMNDKGTHWIKGAMSRKKKVGQTYCSLGGIHAAFNLGRNRTGVRISTRDSKEIEPAVIALANAILEEKKESHRVSDYYSAISTIIGYNDSYITTWEDIRRAFTKAARSPKKYAEMGREVK